MDIQFLAEDQAELLNAFLYLLSNSKAGQQRGVVHIPMTGSQDKLEIPAASPLLYDQVRDMYEGRVQIHVHKNKGLIVPIHGINTDAPWLHYFSLLASCSGWGVAPFVYGNERVTTLLRKQRRDQLVGEFRDWMNKIREVHDGPVSIFAHSLGSYIFARYLMLQGDLKERFCGVVFSGSIVSADYDWTGILDGGRVSAVMNTISSRDTWVARMREGGWPLMNDRLYGRAGLDGFNAHHRLLVQRKYDLLDHNNMFKADMVRTWLNFYEFSLRLYKSRGSRDFEWSSSN